MPVDFNEGGMLGDEMPCVFGVMPYMHESRLIISGIDDGIDGEPQGQNQKASDMSEW